MEFRAVNADGGGGFGEGAGDVGKEFSRDDDAAFFHHFGGDGDFGGDFVVEAIDGESVVVGGEENAGKDGHGGALGDAAGDPGYSVSKITVVDTEVHIGEFHERTGLLLITTFCCLG